MASSLKWDGDKAAKAVLDLAGRRIRACAVTVANRAKVLLSVAGTAPARGGKGPKRYGATRSQPGEPPRKQTGRGRASVAWEIVGLVARVGSNVPYMRFLELGTYRIRARPWLRRALAESMGAIRRILAGNGDGN